MPEQSPGYAFKETTGHVSVCKLTPDLAGLGWGKWGTQTSKKVYVFIPALIASRKAAGN